MVECHKASVMVREKVQGLEYEPGPRICVKGSFKNCVCHYKVNTGILPGVLKNIGNFIG